MNSPMMPVESTIMVAIPELDGAAGPMVYGGRSDGAAVGLRLQQDLEAPWRGLARVSVGPHEAHADDVDDAALPEGRRLTPVVPALALPARIEDVCAVLQHEQVLRPRIDAIEQASVRKGFDPREFVLVAEGGGGPLFAPEIAPEVGLKNVLVPSYPGITAALGLLTTDMVYEYVATSYAMASALYQDRAARKTLEKQFKKLEAEARAQFKHDDIDPKKMRIEHIAEARYEGQGYELRIDVGAGAIDTAWIDAMKAAFHDIHEREYSRRFEDADVQIANVRVRWRSGRGPTGSCNSSSPP
jgi:hypothetical protein